MHTVTKEQKLHVIHFKTLPFTVRLHQLYSRSLHWYHEIDGNSVLAVDFQIDFFWLVCTCLNDQACAFRIDYVLGDVFKQRHVVSTRDQFVLVPAHQSPACELGTCVRALGTPDGEPGDSVVSAREICTRS